MAREDWRDQEDARRGRTRDDFGQADYSQDYAYDPRTRAGYRAADAEPPREDYGQADYTTDWAYDPERGRPYRRFSQDDRGPAPSQPRSFMDRAGDFLAGRPRDEYRRDVGAGPPAPHRRRGPSDRVLWAVIMERLEGARGVDFRHVEVSVVDAEVILNGTVRRKADKRRVENLVDIEGVRNVQNNLRPNDIDHGWRLL